MTLSLLQLVLTEQLGVSRVCDLLQSPPVSEFLYALTKMTLPVPAQGIHWEYLDFLVLVPV